MAGDLRPVEQSGTARVERADAPALQLPEIPKDAPYCFRGRNILLLQGPVGPFFGRLAQDLRWAGANVHKINFNGGDWLYCPRNATNFTRRLDEFPKFLARVCEEKRIDMIMLFGDCRRMHRMASEHAEEHGIEIQVFEEGYIRPDYITMERHGVNGRSLMPRSGIFYLNTPAAEPRMPSPVGPTIWYGGVWAVTYYCWSVLLWPFFPHYRHHRSMHYTEALRWIWGAARKYWHHWKNRPEAKRLLGEDHPKFFLVPLQVHNDAQIDVHSQYDDMEDFLRHVVASFSQHAPEDCALVIKHHPMDRPYTDYTRLVRRLRRKYALGDRLIYVHDLHLPSLIIRSEGVVTINSTTGMSALHHGKPTLATGDAIYRIDGLTATVGLDEFWTRAHEFPVHSELYRKFRHQLIERTQINGNFYRRIDIPGTLAGIDWTRGSAGQD